MAGCSCSCCFCWRSLDLSLLQIESLRLASLAEKSVILLEAGTMVATAVWIIPMMRYDDSFKACFRLVQCRNDAGDLQFTRRVWSMTFEFAECRNDAEKYSYSEILKYV